MSNMFETDDDDFMISPNSKLSSIFNTSTNSEEANGSLTYKAPKQPKSQEITKVPEPEVARENQHQTHSSVVLAKVVSLWKLDNGQNKALGRYMVAIIGNLSNDASELIIYQEKTKIIIRETLGESFSLYKYPNNFVALYDKSKQLWNLNFDSSDNRDIFLKHAIKCNCVVIDQNEQNREGRDVITNVSDLGNEHEKSDVDANEIMQPNSTEKVTSREKILARITKMGQQILPKTIIDRTKSSDLSDSETESSASDPRPIKPVTLPRKFKRNTNIYHEKALAPVLPETHKNFTPHVPSNNNFLIPNNQLMLNPHTAGVMYSQPMPDYGLSNFIIAQNAELKANLAEINIKLNNVLSSPDNNGNSRDDVSQLHTKVKCQNLRIDNLSTDLERSRKAFEELRKKYDEKCEQFVKEQSKIERTKNIEAELNSLQDRVSGISNLQNEIEQLKGDLNERDKQIEILTLKLKGFEDYFKETESMEENCLRENNELGKKIEVMSLKIRLYEEVLKEKENESSVIQNDSLRLDKDKANKIVKESMNEAFISIMENFDENESYDLNHIQGIIQQNLKKTSHRLMNSLL